MNGADQANQNNQHNEIVRLLEAILAELKSQKNPAPLQFQVPYPTISTTPSPCINCQKMADLQRQYPNGYTGDYPCRWCPNSPSRVVCATITRKPGDRIPFTGSCGEHAVYTVQGDGSLKVE